MCVVELDPEGIERLGLERSCAEAAPALLAEQPLEQIRGPDRAAMRDRERELRDARVEVVAEACDRHRLLALGVRDEVPAPHARDLERRHLIASKRSRLELGPGRLRHQRRQVSRAVREAALPNRASEALVCRANQASTAVGAVLDRLLHHRHETKRGPRSWRTRTGAQDLGESVEAK